MTVRADRTVRTNGISRSEWLKCRKVAIGGSEAGLAKKIPSEDQMLSLIEQGYSFADASRMLGLGPHFISCRRSRSPEFKQMSDRAREFGRKLAG